MASERGSEHLNITSMELNEIMDPHRQTNDRNQLRENDETESQTTTQTEINHLEDTITPVEDAGIPEILRGALHKTPIDLLIKHIKSTPDKEFPDDADITTRLEAYAFNELFKLPNVSAREVSLRIIAEAKKEISNTSPIFVAYRGIRSYANKITRARHHHNFLNKCITNEWTPKGLSLQRRINPIGGNAQLEITIREIQFKAEKAILETLLFHYSELSIATIGELEGLEKVLSKSTSKYVNNVKCRIILETEELALGLRKKNTEKAEANNKKRNKEKVWMRRNRVRRENAQTPSDTTETTQEQNQAIWLHKEGRLRIHSQSGKPRHLLYGYNYWSEVKNLYPPQTLGIITYGHQKWTL